MISIKQRIPLLMELGIADSAIEPITGYLNLLWQANNDLNLLSRQMHEHELIENHLIDCLLPWRDFESLDGVKKVADFGSGGGFPGVLYAILRPDLQFYLYEKSKKKQIFLEACVKKFAANIQVKGEIPQDFGGVDLVISRAFKPLDVILDMSRKYYAKKGRYFLLKGRHEKVLEEIALAKKKFVDLNVNIIRLQSPVLEVERNLLII